MHAVTYALLAVLASATGDPHLADEHLRAADRWRRVAARREHQIVEIAALIVDGDVDRARDLSCEHTTEFPDDKHLMSSLLDTHGREPPATRAGQGS